MKPYVASMLAASLLTGGSAAIVSPVSAQTIPHAAQTTHHRPMDTQNMRDEQAKLLGITSTDLQSRLAAGKTFQQIATDLGITPDQLKTRMQDAEKARLQALVTSGKLTQAQADQMSQHAGQFHPGMPMKGGKSMDKTAFLEGQAKLLGIPTDDLSARLASGKTFDQIATDLGITKDQLKTRMQDAQKARVQALVTSGKLTQAQADQILQRMVQPHQGMPQKGMPMKGKPMNKGTSHQPGRWNKNASTPTASTSS